MTQGVAGIFTGPLPVRTAVIKPPMQAGLGSKVA